MVNQATKKGKDLEMEQFYTPGSLEKVLL